MQVKTRVSVITAIVATTLAAAAPAVAAATIVTAAPGTTVHLETRTLWTLPTTPMVSGTVTFLAPTGTTFPAQTSVTAAYSRDGGATFASNHLTLTGCTTSTNDTVLTCTIGSDDGTPLTWDNGSTWRFTPAVAVSPNAPAGSYSTPVAINFSYGNGGFRTGDTLDIQITEKFAIPVAAPLLAGGAGIAALAGALIVRRRKNAQATA